MEAFSNIENKGTSAFGTIGDIKLQGGSVVPAGWMLCEGQLLAVADYPLLFAALSSVYGGDGVNNFALPSYRNPGAGATRIICVDYQSPQPVLQVTVPAAIHGSVPGYYKAGTTLSFSVQLLEDIAITGGPVSLDIDIGGTVHTLAFVSGSAREWVFANYVVQAGDTGDVTAAIDLNGATLSSGGITAVLSTALTVTGVIVDTTAPATPTVNTQSTANTTPTITGTAAVGVSESLTVVVNGVTYTDGDGKLSLSGTAWSLVIPAGNALSVGTYDVNATVTDLAGNSTSDATSGELVITA
ncbi:MAG: tail fiber protein [Methylobacter sp.]